MDRQRQTEKYKKSPTNSIEAAPGSSQPRPDPVRSAGHKILNGELHDGVSQRDCGGLRDYASVGVQEWRDKRSE